MDKFVEALRRECAGATLDLAVRVGQLVIDSFYRGDLTTWRLHGKGHPSLRGLASRRDVPISISQLYRCVAIYELSQMLPAFSTWKHLGASHVRAVLGLDRHDQEHLLERAEHEDWSVARLEDETRSVRKARGSRRGRAPLSERSKNVRAIQRWLDECPSAAIDPSYLDARTREDLLERVAVVRSRCVEIEATLQPADSIGKIGPGKSRFFED